MTIKTEYNFWEMVYIKTDPDQSLRQVTGVEIYPGNTHVYFLSLGTITSGHYEGEISREINTDLKYSS